MRQVQVSSKADAFAMAMWASASQVGYRPATLSLARQLVRSGAYGRQRSMAGVEARFRKLASSGKDADALTVAGEFLYEQGRFEAAVATLRDALATEAPDFEWKPYSQLCLGKALLKLNRCDEALVVLKPLSESGLPEADAELGHLLKNRDSSKAAQHFFAASCNGKRDMFHYLAQLALEPSSLAAGQDSDPEERRRWASEWSRLADPRSEY